MSSMLEPQWAPRVKAFIKDSMRGYALYADHARSLGSRLMTDSFLENVMIQKLDHRSGLRCFLPRRCKDVQDCQGLRCSSAEEH